MRIRACPYQRIPVLICDAKRGETLNAPNLEEGRKFLVHEKILASMKRKRLAYRAFVYFRNQRHTHTFTYENSFGFAFSRIFKNIKKF